MGLASAALRAAHPRLITCDISGYGEDGPYRDMKAYDLLVQAETGLCSVTGGPDGAARVGVSVCDIAAGMYSHAAILQALYARNKTGQGRGLQVSLFDGMADWMNVPYLQRRYGGTIPLRAGLKHPSIAPYGIFSCRDGDLLLSIQNEREWVTFCREVMDDAPMARDERYNDGVARVAHRAQLDDRINTHFVAHPRAAIADRLRRAGIAYGILNDIDGLIAHPQLRTVTFDTPSGEVAVIAPAARIVGNELRLRPVPAVDADGAAIRAEFAVDQH
jgi:crotonobetainyl-CoA:carnitine CoA-transferase CaiB-like acyl-CoA transferase